MTTICTTAVSKMYRRFAKDTRGAVALIFAAAVVVLSLVVAGSIEIHRRNQAIVELQNAADAAALAAKVEQAKKKTLLDKILAWLAGKKAGESVFSKAMMSSKYFTKGKKPAPKIEFNDDESVTVTVTVTAQQEFDLMFGGLIPAKFANITVSATANHQAGVPTEVAMVLDNTASMFNLDGRASTRFTLMRDAAKKFTHQLFNAAESQGSVADVRVSVVPWATTVNVLGERPSAKDHTGNATVFSIKDKGSEVQVSSPIARSGTTVTVDSTLFAPVDWRGCIKGDGESTGYDDAGVSKWTALNVPETKSGWVNIAVGPLKTTTNNECNCTAYGDDGNTNCGGGSGGGVQGFNRLIERAVPQISNASFLFNRDLKDADKAPIDRTCSVCLTQSCGPVTRTNPDCTAQPYSTYRYCYAWHDNGSMNAFTSAAKIGCTQQWWACGDKAPVLENVPACVADPNEPKWINGTVPWCANYDEAGSKTWNSKHWNNDIKYYPIGGPNLNCPAPILGLSANRKQVLSALDRMFPVPGGTHADVGLRWGLRTLTPNNNWSTFFGVTAKPTNFKTESKKVMILLTDGENEQAIDFPGYWGCKGKFGTDPSQPDCKGSPDRVELDTRMQGWCKAIRSTYGITLYAISVNVAGASARDKLVECTGDATKVFNVDASDLSATLNSIGAQIMAMRLTK